MRKPNQPIYQFWFLLLWAVFTVSLTVWWIIFGLNQLNLITQAGVQSSAELIRGHRMLLLEGATLIVSLLAGAFSFYLLGLREKRQSNAVQNFLMTFTHELRTPIASLRLQAEELGERLKTSSEKTLLDRLVTDTSRLTLQLDNSLFLASADSDQLIVEEIDLNEMIGFMIDEWPNLDLQIYGHALVNADRRALQSIFRNLFHNAVVHGKASKVEVGFKQLDDDNLEIRVNDNGLGFQGDLKRIGKLFDRQYSGSGSGVGLYLISKLARMSGGSAAPSDASQGFCLNIVLPGRVKL